jgi:hypothetical protein
MGWEKIPWYTITNSFDADFGVDEWHGHNAFVRDGERVFRTYFINMKTQYSTRKLRASAEGASHVNLKFAT